MIYVMRTSDGALLIAESVEALGHAAVQLTSEEPDAIGVRFEKLPPNIDEFVGMPSERFTNGELAALATAMTEEKRRLGS